jgi:hypothetical protein
MERWNNVSFICREGTTQGKASLKENWNIYSIQQWKI